MSSLASTTRPILAPPTIPFASQASAKAASSSTLQTSVVALHHHDGHVPLSLNYLPTKFSSPHNTQGIHKRRSAKQKGVSLPKRGGGRDAFRRQEARMAGEHDEDDDPWADRPDDEKPKSSKNLRWNRFKWILFLANAILTAYSLVGLISCLLTWFGVWNHADIVRVANKPELVVATMAASLGLLTSIVGWSGILLNERSFLAVYNLLLWICFAFLVAPGYITYRRRRLNLEGKINSQWSRDLGIQGRLIVQNQLNCCGYFSPFVEATITQTCFARSLLPGCKLPFLKFERKVLQKFYEVAFLLVPFHLFIMIAALLCSNHVTYRFGKGMMPKAYRLSLNSMALLMDQYASHLADQYGTDVASDFITKSNVHLDVYQNTNQSPQGYGHGHSNSEFDPP